MLVTACCLPSICVVHGSPMTGVNTAHALSPPLLTSVLDNAMMCLVSTTPLWHTLWCHVKAPLRSDTRWGFLLPNPKRRFAFLLLTFADVADIHASMNDTNEYTAKVGKPLTYRFDLVAAGNPISIPADKYLVARSAACHWGKRHGVKLTVRKFGGGYQCWRVE